MFRVCGEVVIWSFVCVELLLPWCVACSIACKICIFLHRVLQLCLYGRAVIL